MKRFTHAHWIGAIALTVSLSSLVRAQEPEETAYPEDSQVESSSDEPESPVRAPEESFDEALNRVYKKSLSVRRPSGTALGRARLFKPGLDASTLPEWEGSSQELQSVFEELRDERVYFERKRPRFPRRASWLYPEDGCYARSAHMVRSFVRQGLRKPGQVFAFGRLRMKTKYNIGGVADWWYHVATAIRVDGKAYVLDPSVEPRGPVPLATWLARFSLDPRSVKVSFCDANAYTPRSTCIGGKKRPDETTIRHQVRYLDLEWNMLKRLKYSPVNLLGDEPPWISPSLSEQERRRERSR